MIPNDLLYSFLNERTNQGTNWMNIQMQTENENEIFVWQSCENEIRMLMSGMNEWINNVRMK